MRPHGAERDRFEHGGPTVGERVGREVGGGCGGELAGELSGEAHARLGGLRRELERPHDPAHADGCVDVAEPQVQLLLLLGDERFLQLGGNLAGGLVAGHHRILAGSDDAAEVAQIQLVEVGERGVGPVEPLGDAKLRQQLLCDGQQTCGGNLFLAFGAESLVLFVHGLAYRRNAALERTLGDGLLCLGQVGEHGVAVGAVRLEALGLGA